MANLTPLERFWSKVDKRGPEDCWEWTGGRNGQGYGVFYVANEKFYAHRWITAQAIGRPLRGPRDGHPAGTEDACHRCDNPPCCNPNHLYVGTRKRNAADAVERARLWQFKVTCCPQGHPYEGDNLYIKPSGARACRTCRKIKDQEAKARAKAARTHCRHGHPLSDDNLLLCKNGTRKCRTCDKARLEKIHSRPRLL
ncbi:HNH endonuclease [Streptomyces sparsogenes]|uniref:HNH endonuclease n=1 Tax=Streptomyces sparsogenes TaxID=67365 RepID=UPI0033FEF870